MVRHLPSLGGEIIGSVHVLSSEDLQIGGRTRVVGDILLPGTPQIDVKGKGSVGALDYGDGSPKPGDYSVRLTGAGSVQRLILRTDPIELDAVPRPMPPVGNRSVSIKQSGDEIGDPQTLRNLALDGAAGSVRLPPGDYGHLTAGGDTQFILGTAGATARDTYHLESLTINGRAGILLAGPVQLVISEAVELSGAASSTGPPEALVIDLAENASLTLKGRAILHAAVRAPHGTVSISGAAEYVGAIQANRLMTDQASVVRLTAITVNQPPFVALTSPANGAVVPAYSEVELAATASALDGNVGRVEFWTDGILLAIDSAEPFQYLWRNVPVGLHVITAQAYDEQGATALSEPITLQAAQNEAPAVALTTPENGAEFVVPAEFVVSAVATDSDGSIARVDFLESSGQILGSLAAPTELPATYLLAVSFPAGSYSVLARAYDNTGGFADSASVSIRAFPALPYLTDFEVSDGYLAGSFTGHHGWTVHSGTVMVQAENAAAGEQFISILPSTSPGLLEQEFRAEPQPVVFVDLYARLFAESDADAASIVATDHGEITAIRNGGMGEVYLRDGMEVWRRGDVPVLWPLSVDGRSADWIRFTVREDYAAEKWDLYVNGSLVAVDLGFSSPRQSSFSTLAARGHVSAVTSIDDLYIGAANPLFMDADQDGIDDEYELANGFDAWRNDRTDDVDGDGISNLKAYLFGIGGNLVDSDNDGMPDWWERRYGLDPLTSGRSSDADLDGVLDAIEYLQGRDPTVGAVPTEDPSFLRVYSPAAEL